MYSLYQQINSHLQEYKAALTDENVWLTVAGRLGKLLNIVSDKNLCSLISMCLYMCVMCMYVWYGVCVRAHQL